MWSRTIVPTMAMYLLSAEDEYHAEDHVGEKQGFLRRFQQGFERSFERFREGYQHALEHVLEHSRLFAAGFLAFCVLSCTVALVLGRDFFPAWTPARSACICVRAPGFASKRPRASRSGQSDHS